MSDLSFDHERLDVYKVSIDFIVLSDLLIAGLPPGRSYLGDQLHRAASSIILNIAEGAGEFSKKDKARFYRMARRSATECAGVLDICRYLKLSDLDMISSGRSLLLRIVAMLVSLVKAMGPS
ncbi:MAG: four helix bundle protein [Gemmataceae bacterium]